MVIEMAQRGEVSLSGEEAGRVTKGNDGGTVGEELLGKSLDVSGCEGDRAEGLALVERVAGGEGGMGKGALGKVGEGDVGGTDSTVELLLGDGLSGETTELSLEGGGEELGLSRRARTSLDSEEAVVGVEDEVRVELGPGVLLTDSVETAGEARAGVDTTGSAEELQDDIGDVTLSKALGGIGKGDRGATGGSLTELSSKVLGLLLGDGASGSGELAETVGDVLDKAIVLTD